MNEYFTVESTHCGGPFLPLEIAAGGAVCFADSHGHAWFTHPASLGGDSWVIATATMLHTEDINMDGAVDLLDFQILVDNFNTAGTAAQGDITFDGRINMADFLKFRKGFFAHTAQAAAVPEPTSAVLMLLAGLSLLHLSQRRRPYARPRSWTSSPCQCDKAT